MSVLASMAPPKACTLDDALERQKTKHERRNEAWPVKIACVSTLSRAVMSIAPPFERIDPPMFLTFAARTDTFPRRR